METKTEAVRVDTFYISSGTILGLNNIKEQEDNKKNNKTYKIVRVGLV